MDRIRYFRDQARQCRDAARRSVDREDRHGFEQLARHYDREAARLDDTNPATATAHSESASA
jgi:hypothetical protein